MKRRIWVILGIAAFSIIIVALVIINNNWSSPSMVDVTPLSQLTKEQVRRIDDVWTRLEQHNHVQWLFTDEDPLDPFNQGQLYVHTIRWHSGSDEALPNAWLLVMAIGFDDEDVTARRMEWFMEPPDNENRPQRIGIIYDNNTGAQLDHMRFDRFFVDRRNPIPGFSIWTLSRIRIGHVEITLHEKQPRLGRGDYSSEFIAVLVEMLQEADES